MIDNNRREFFRHLAAITGSFVVAPVVVACGASALSGNKINPQATVDASGAPKIPMVRPENWDGISFNKDRGLKGAIPKSYYPDITGPDGEKGHLGKHLPYIPKIDPADYPNGYIPVMWGDPALGYTQHPSQEKGSEGYPRGHWFNWIRVRKAVTEDAEERESQFFNWPGPDDVDGTVFGVFGKGDIRENTGKNTIYMLASPPDLASGDVIRVYGHCLYHGEYVDFIEYNL
jgi:hypothetical protein